MTLSGPRAIAEAELLLQRLVRARDSEFLSPEESRADCRIMLRLARVQFPNDAEIAACLESDTPAQQREDEALFERWCLRHGYAVDEIRRDRANRPVHFREWLAEQGLAA